MNKGIPQFLMDKLINQYGSDVDKIINGYKKKRYTTFRINELKSNKKEIIDILLSKNFILEEVKDIPYAFIVKNKTEKDLKELDIYKNGFIYIQSLSSMLPVIALDPKECEHILDMTAAPGSKTTQIAMITNNKARITACERNKIRCDRLKYNLDLQGVKCTTVMNIDSRDLDDLFSFDKILLDAPCSGSGVVFINNISENNIFNKEQFEKLKKNQLTLLRKALKLLKPKEKIVYSTCSILSCENEEVIEEIKKEFDITILKTNLDLSNCNLLPTKIDGTICICPDEYYEGFFIALIQKNS